MSAPLGRPWNKMKANSQSCRLKKIWKRYELNSMQVSGLSFSFEAAIPNEDSSVNQSINHYFILTRYVKELKNSFKIQTCINKIYNNYSYIILFSFKNNSINIYI